MNASALGMAVCLILVIGMLILVGIGQVPWADVDTYVGYVIVGALALAAPKPELRAPAE